MESKYSDFWALKMKKVFNALDVVKSGKLSLSHIRECARTSYAGLAGSKCTLRINLKFCTQQNSWCEKNSSPS